MIRALIKAPIGADISGVLAGQAGGAAPSTLREIAYLGNDVSATDLTTYTFSSKDLGAAAVSRRIVVAVSTRSTVTVSALTVAGVSATFVGGQTNSSHRSEIWIADVPTGTIGNIVVTWSGAATRCGIGWWRMLNGASGSVYWTGGATSNGAIATTSPPNGVGIGISSMNSGTSATWTGATERFDGVVEATVLHTGADFSVTDGTTNYPVTCAWAAGSGQATLVAVWGQDDSDDAYRYGPGAWSWFGVRRGAVIGSDLIMSSSTANGSIAVLRPAAVPVILKTGLSVNDHNNPCLLRRSSDGRIIAQYCQHVGTSYFQRISTNPDDVSAWGAEVDLDASFGATNYSYANLVEVTAGIFAFLRAETVGDYSLHYSLSTDNGATWPAVTKLLDGTRPYFRMIKSGANRIDFVCNDGIPGTVADNSTYHFYYDAGTWKKTDGTALGALPYLPSTALTRIYDGTPAPSWVWDVAFNTVPVVVFVVFVNAATDHRYYYAKWSGSAWDTHEICTAGGPISASESDYYSGGICIDPDDINTIYCSREDGSGIHQIWKGVTANGGSTWTMTQLTTETEMVCMRPNKEPGSSVLTYMRGTYTTYTDYDTHIKRLTLA